MTTTEEKLKIIADIARKIPMDVCRKYYYPDIPERICRKALSAFDSKIDTEMIGVFIDTTLRHNAKNGIIFTPEGIYDRQLMEKTRYIDYWDIDKYEVVPNKSGKVEDFAGKINIFMKDGSVYFSTNVGDDFRKMLDQLLPIVKTWGTKEEQKTRQNAMETYRLTPELLEKSRTIIQSASEAMKGLHMDLNQITPPDSALIVNMQTSMVSGIGTVFEEQLSQPEAQELVLNFLDKISEYSPDKIFGSFLPLVPESIDTASVSGLTEMVCWMAVCHFCQKKISDRARLIDSCLHYQFDTEAHEYEQNLRNRAMYFLAKNNSHQQYVQIVEEYRSYLNSLKEKIDVVEAEGGLKVPKCLKNTYAQMCDEMEHLVKLGQ